MRRRTFPKCNLKYTPAQMFVAYETDQVDCLFTRTIFTRKQMEISLKDSIIKLCLKCYLNRYCTLIC